MGPILEHGVPRWALVSQGVAQPILLSSLDLGFFLCLSCSSQDLFVCDFVLPFDLKDGPQPSVNDSLHFVCYGLCYAPGFICVKKD